MMFYIVLCRTTWSTKYFWYQIDKAKSLGGQRLILRPKQRRRATFASITLPFLIYTWAFTLAPGIPMQALASILALLCNYECDDAD